MQIVVETERLILRELLPTDLEGMFELDSDPEVHRYLGNQPVQEREQLAGIIEFVRQQYNENGIGRWAVIDKETKTFMGWSGLKFVKEMTNDHINYYDLGYRLIRKYWGKGFATESAIASLNYGFTTLQLDEIFAATQLGNMASNRILKKLGFQQRGVFHFYSEVNNWYRIGVEDWKGR